MKKPVSILVLVIFACLACIPSFAQQVRSVRNSEVRGAIAEYERIVAFSDGQGVYMRWEMRSELGNVGFLVYRAGETGLELVSPGLIMSFYAGVSDRTFYGATYEFYDPAGTLDTSYVIQNQFLNGNRVSTDSFMPRFTDDFPRDTGHTKAELEDRARSKHGIVNKGNPALPADLQAIVARSILPPDPAMQRVVVTQQGVKIAVKKEGMYRVTRTELEDAGFDVNSNSANWRLFMNGNEQAINIGAGNQYIEFYGKGLDTRQTDTRTYYLISDTVAGKRMISKFLGNIGGNVLSHNYRFAVEKKERVSWNQRIKNGDTENYWGYAVISDPPKIVSFNLTAVDLSGPNAVITVKCQGLPFSQQQHAIQVKINDHDIGVINGSNTNNFSGDLSVPSSFLTEGNNILKLVTSSSSDAVYFDSVKVSYSRKYQADQQRVLFFTPGYRKIDVTGFTTANIRVFDTTLDGNPQLITDLPITQNGSTYSVRMPSNRPAVMYGVEDSGLLHSPSITPDNASTLATTNNLADVIIISHSAADFIAAAETWANYRRSQAGGNFTVKVVDIEDIFDEFSYGSHRDAAIKSFLQYAKTNWQNPKPHYVLIIGDASDDPRNYEGFGNLDLVPTLNVELIYEETGSDEAFADFDHDGLAEMAIGRIPARTSSVITDVFNKTTAFEVPAIQSLDRGALFAFDIPIGFDFNAMSQIIAGQLPSRMPKTFINRGIPEPNPNHQQDPMAHENLMNALNTGKYIVNYAGHGSTGVWASAAFFSVNDVQFLTNANRQSIFTMLTCWNGLFTRPQYDSLGEALLKATNGGAVATWASTTETTPDYQLTMGARFYYKIGQGDITRIGDLVIDAKTTIAGSDVGYSWALLGDPALKVRQ